MSSTTNVLQLPSPPGGDRQHSGSEAAIEMIPARVHELIADADMRNLKLLPKHHNVVEGLAEDIAVADAQITVKSREAEQAETRWLDFSNLSTHWTPLHWLLMFGGLTVLTLAETALAATVMAGLDLTDAERWLVALGTTSGATLGVKALATSWKSLADDQKDNIPVAAKHRWAIGFGVVAIIVILLGQFLARESYAEQAQAAGNEGVSWILAAGLTLLQCGLYAAAAFFLYVRLPPARMQQAYEQVVATRKALTKLHRERAKLAGRLNKAVYTLRGQWAEHQAYTRSLVFEYIQERANAGGGQPVKDFQFDSSHFLPIPEWINSADQLVLRSADAIVANGNTTPSEIAAAKQRRDGILLGTAYPAIEAPTNRESKIGESK